jgi:hypothetical protein
MEGTRQQRAEHYRTRAHEIRAVAEGMRLTETSRALMRLAASYDRLALELEEHSSKH